MSTFPVNGLSVDLDLSSYATKEELATISLTPGPQGLKGDAGADGATGVKGDTGDVGAQGPAGADGVAGQQGIQGVQGERGDVGPVGAQGETGAKGDAGVAGPQGEQGPPGQVIQVDHEGLQGVQGERGAKGDAGDKGDAGEVGPMGPAGAEGPQGVQGPQGEHGADGVAGPAGQVGPQGPKGDQGDKGDVGAQGIQGIQGPKGDVGTPGAQGPAGSQGIQGIQGPAGANGQQGPAGAGTQTQLDALQRQIDELKAAVAKCCGNVVPDNDYIPTGAFVHIDGKTGNSNDQTGHGYNAVNQGAVYDAANKCWNFTGSMSTSQSLEINPQTYVTSIPGMTQADFDKLAQGARNLSANVGTEQAPRTFLTWVKFKPFPFSNVDPDGGSKRYQYAVGFGRNESGAQFSLGSTADCKPLIYTGMESSNKDRQLGVAQLPAVVGVSNATQVIDQAYPDQWILMTVTATTIGNRRGKVTLYVNDCEKTAAYDTGLPMATIGDKFFIGKFCCPNGTEQHSLQGLNGSVGTVTVYNRVLTPAEISQYYKATKATYGK
jgi:hypothetical protein